MEIVQNLFRTLMFFLDNIVYGLIPEIYKIFVYLSELNLYGDSSSPIQKLVSHIYVLLGIFMLFKISFSLLQYIVDPSAFRDSSKGMGKLVTNVLVTLVLLVSVPFIFDKAMDLQTEIVQSNVIGQLILGTSMGDLQSDDESNNTIQEIEKRAKDVQFMMFGAFYSLNPAVTENEQFNGCNGKSGVFGAIDMATEDCLNDLNEAISRYDDASANDVTLYSFFKHGTDGTDDRNFSHFDKLLWWKVDGNYVINYLPFISTAAGIYVVFLLITFCVDIAVRTIKLCFLQMIAPIAIVSYIDPKESISNGKLSAWIKECASTYFSLFLRLATIFLVILLISVISSSILADGGYISGQINSNKYNIWLYLFLIIGAFMFAKQVPKMIESIFGIKGSGELSLNPLKNAGFNALAGGAVGLGIGVAGAATGAGIGRIASGTLGGFRGGLGGKKIGEVAGMQADANRRMGIARANGSTRIGRMGAKISTTLGTPGRMGRIINSKEAIEKENSMRENYANAVSAYESDIESAITSGKIDDEHGGYSSAYFKRVEELNALRQANEVRRQNLGELDRNYANGGNLNYTYTNSQTGEQITVSLGRNDVNYDKAYKQQREKLDREIGMADGDIIKKQVENQKELEQAVYNYANDVEHGRVTDHKIMGKIQDSQAYAKLAHDNGIDIEWKANAADRHKDAGAQRGIINDNNRSMIEKDYSGQEKKAQADIDAVQGKPGGPRRPRGGRPGLGGPRGLGGPGGPGGPRQ